MDQLEMKKLAARAALKYVKPETIVGVGSGSTVNCFIEALGELKDQIQGAVAASKACLLYTSDKLPTSFQITNGKKLYPMENVNVKKVEKKIQYNKQTVTEITYSFKTGNKDIMVKKFSGEQFPRYIKYSRDGDDYELEFDEFVK